MGIFQSQNPGIGGLDELTDSELAFLQNLVTLPYVSGDILYHDGTNLVRLPKGSDSQVLTLALGIPAWSSAAGGNLEDLTDVTITTGAAYDILYRDSLNGEWINLPIGTEGQVLSVSAASPQWVNSAASGISGTTGAVDGGLIIADGIGGSTVKPASNIVVDGSDNITGMQSLNLATLGIIKIDSVTIIEEDGGNSTDIKNIRDYTGETINVAKSFATTDNEGEITFSKSDITLTAAANITDSNYFALQGKLTWNSANDLAASPNGASGALYGSFDISGAGDATGIAGLAALGIQSGTGTSDDIYGVIGTMGATGGAITSGAGIASQVFIAGGAITDAIMFEGKAVLNFAGSVTNLYGLLIPSLTDGSTINTAIKTNTGLIDFGDNVTIAASKALQFAGTAILSDSAGTMTLSNIDALDATTEATIEAAIDTLANLSSIGSELSMGANSIGFTMQTATGDGATTVDWKLGNHFDFTFGAFNETFTFTAPTKPGVYTMSLKQDSVGSRTATFPATVKWAGGTAPTLTTTATTGYDIVSFRFDGTNYYSTASLDFS